MSKRKSPIVKLQKLHPLGSSYVIVIPKDWFEANEIDPKSIEKLLMVADMDIRIVNPKHEAKVYKEITQVTKNAQTTTKSSEKLEKKKDE